MTLNLRDVDSRESQTRETGKRKHWKPKAALTTPPPLDGYVYRWVRHEIKGQDDSKNVVESMHQGYEPVRPDELPEDFVTNIIDDGKYKGVVRCGDLILCKMPESMNKEKREYIDKRTERLQDSVDSNLMQNQNPAMPISDESRSSVTRGRPDFQED